MKEQEKSIKLAKLMGWDMSDVLGKDYITTSMGQPEFLAQMCLRPYGSMPNDLAQFAAILLKFPEVMWSLGSNPEGLLNIPTQWFNKPTQSNILDEILKLNGVKI